jgi:crotonobetainyl-CoA:carnitine CoA-transferase CaiB-like acyl-CoA transferase
MKGLSAEGSEHMGSALEGIRVLDLSQFLSGPRCTQILADMGADVIKLEPPVWGETLRLMLSPIPGMDRALSNWNRNKRGITLDIRDPRGKEIYWQLAERVDVVVENFAPGFMDRLGLGWEEHHRRNPRLIYCSITGFGRNGPCAERVAFDLIAQASGGIMFAQKTPHMTPGVFFGDFVSGAYAALGVLQAILARARTDQGQLVDISMQDVMYFHNFRALDVRTTQGIHESIQSTLGQSFDDVLTGEEHPFPCWYSYPARGGYVACVILTDRQWDNMVENVMKRPDLATRNPKYSNLIMRLKHRDDYLQEFKEWFSQRTPHEVERILVEQRIPCSVVKDLEQVNSDPQLRARDMHMEVVHARYGPVPVPGTPIKLSDTPNEIRDAAPDLGQHNAEVYGELLGLTEGEVQILRDQGIL